MNCMALPPRTCLEESAAKPPTPGRKPPVFQTTNGAPLALYGASNYERVVGRIPDGFRGFTLCVNLASMDEVRDFSWRDPEGNIWDVAWAHGSTFDDRGGVVFP